MKKFVITILSVLLFGFVNAQTDTIFWFAAPRAAANHANKPIEFRMSTSSDVPVTYKVSQPAATAVQFPPITGTIPANGNIVVDLTNRITRVMNDPANTVLNYGLLIETSAPISVYYEICSRVVTGAPSPNNPEIFSLKGKNALGTEFYIPGQTEFNNNGYSNPVSRNVFDIIATEDGTTVTIFTPKALEGRAAGSTFTITLNKGQTWSGVATGPAAANHIAGAHVTSDKPIAITVSDDSIVWGGAHDMAGDQIVPVDVLGTRYIAVRGDQNRPTTATQDKERIYITATQPNTRVVFSHKGNLITGATITTIANAGETVSIDFVKSGVLVDHIYIESLDEKPIYVYHLTPFYNSTWTNGEFGGALLPQIDCTGSTKVVYTRGYRRTDVSTSQKLYLNICVPTDGINGFTLNGNPNVIRALNFTPVDGLRPVSGVAQAPPDWQYARIAIDPGVVNYEATMTIENQTPFHAGIFDGSNAGASYGYYSDFGLSLEPQGATNVTDNTTGIHSACAGQTVNFFLVNETALQNISWIGPRNNTILPDEDNPNRITIKDVKKEDEGEYKVMAESRSGCEVKPVSMYLTVSEPSSKVDVVHSICYKPGSFKIEAYDGVPDYKINWRITGGGTNIADSEFESVFEADELATGTYYFTITDKQGCETNDTIVILPVGEDPPTPAFRDTTICNGSAYRVDMATNTGLSYKWQDGSTNPFYTFPSTGDYGLTVTTTEGCTSFKEWHVEFVKLSATTSHRNVSCYGGSDGSITAAGIGTASTFTYDWSYKDRNGEVIRDIPVGSYVVTITDQFGCTVTASQDITSPDSLVVKSSVLEHLKCPGDDTGKASVTVSGGTPSDGAMPYRIMWNTPGVQGFNPENLTGGDHMYTITDGNDCRSIHKITIDSPPEIVIENQSPTALCYGDELRVVIEATGGTEPLSIKWQDGTTSMIHNSVPAGTQFKFTITDSNNCSRQSFVDIESPLPLEIVPKVFDVRCKGGDDGYITITTAGGTSPYSIKWDNGKNENSITDLTPGMYSVTVTDANKCTFTRDVSVSEPENELKLEIDKKDNACYGDEGSLFLKATGGVAPYNYHAFNSYYEAWGDVINNIPAGKYNLEATDANNCKSIDTVTIKQLPRILADLKVIQPTCRGKSDGAIAMNIIGGEAPYVVQKSVITYDTLTIKDFSAGTYYIEIIDNNNCVSVETVSLEESDMDCIEIPNTFTPNDDDVNDFWIIENIEMFPNAIVQVFNQWGQMLFNSKDSETMEWDGKFNNNKVPTGSYVYVIELFDINKTKYTGVVYVTY